MLRRVIVLAAVAGLAAGQALAAAQTQPGKSTRDDKLFRNLGGVEGITALVDDFVARVGADARVNGRFARTDLDAMKKHMVDQLCAEAGGPCVYAGRDMKTVHAGMGITSEEFGMVMGHLIAALKARKVSPKDEGALVGLLLPMKPSIVERP